MSELNLLVGRKAHQPSGPVNPAGNQFRERRLPQQLDLWRRVVQSFAAPERTAKLGICGRSVTTIPNSSSGILDPLYVESPYLHLSIVSANRAAGEWQIWV